MRFDWLLGVAAASFLGSGCFGGCGDLGGKAAQLALEKATGVSVDGDGNVKIKTDEGAVEISSDGEDGLKFKGKDGEELHIGGKTVKAPAGFPLPIMDEATIASSIAGGKAGEKSYMVVANLPFDTDPEAVAAFYEKELEGKGIEVERSDFEINGLVSVTLAGTAAGGSKANVLITKNTAATEEEGDRAVNVTLNWESAKAEAKAE